jgi:hypothetical protein
MRNLWIVVLVALLLAMAGAAHADAATDALRATVESLQKQLTDALDRLKALEAAKPAAVPAPAPEAKASWTDKLLITAYAHFRYEARDNAVGRFPNGPYAAWPTAVSTPADEFLIRRMYLNFIATPNSKTKIVLALRRLGGSPQTIDLESAFVEYALDDAWSVEFGRVYNKFGWDTWESSSKRLVLDRFAAGEGYGNGGLRGLYSNGPTDMGMYITRKPWADYAPKVHLGLFNGNFIDPENNGNKAYSVDLRWDRNDWHWGLGWIDGDYTESYSAAGQPTVTNTFDRTMFGLYLRKDPKPWGVQAEWVDGKLFGNDVTGWYAQGSRLVGDNGTAFVRYEEYEPTDTPAITGDAFHAWRIGYAYQVDKNNELTFEYMPARRGSTDVGQFGFQWQAGF